MAGGGERESQTTRSDVSPPSQFSMFYTQEMAFLKPGGMGEGVSGGWINEWRGARAQGPWGPFQTAVPTAGHLSTGPLPIPGQGRARGGREGRRASKLMEICSSNIFILSVRGPVCLQQQQQC